MFRCHLLVPSVSIMHFQINIGASNSPWLKAFVITRIFIRLKNTEKQKRLEETIPFKHYLSTMVHAFNT